MATETVSMEVSDSELFAGAIAETPEPESQPEPAEPEAPEQPRDEHGRFAPKAEAVPEQPAPAKPEPEPTKDDQAGNVPSWRLREVNQAREAAETRATQEAAQRLAMQQQFDTLQRELAELRKPKAEPVDFFQDPNKAFEQQLSPFQEELAQVRRTALLNSSKALNIAIHGFPAVKEMEAAVEKAFQSGDHEMGILSQRMSKSDDPIGIAMDWYKTQKLVQETGGDPAKYREKVADELLKDPAFQKRMVEMLKGQAGQTPPVIQMPPSLNRAPGSGVTSAELDDNDMSNGALFRDAASGLRTARR